MKEKFPTPQGYSHGAEVRPPGLTKLDIAVRPEMEKHAERAKERRAFPTPRQSDADRGGRGDLIQSVRGNSNPHFKTWGTPKVQDSRHAHTDRGKSNLGEQVSGMTGGGGQLSPDWVCWLMGWPIGWTSLEPLFRETFDEWERRTRAGEWFDAESEGVPRVAVGVPQRVNRLKAIGNGQVPACAALAWETLSGRFRD